MIRVVDGMIIQSDTRVPALIFCLVVLVALAALAGCAASGGSQGETPAEGTERTRIWNTPDADEPEPQNQMGPYVEEPEPDPEPEPESEDDQIGPSVGDISGDLFRNTWTEVIFRYSRTSLAGDTPPGMNIYSFILSRGPVDVLDRMYIGLYYGRGRSSRGRDIQDILGWVSEAGFDVGARAYFTSDSTGTGLFAMFGLRTGGLFWSYSQTIEATDADGETDTYSHDSVWVTTPYVGGGVSFFQSGEFKLGINASAGYRVAGEKTLHGLDEGLFKNVWEYKVNFEVIFNLNKPDSNDNSD